MQRLYTVGLPPKGWVPPLLEPPSCSSSESSSNSEDTGGKVADSPKGLPGSQPHVNFNGGECHMAMWPAVITDTCEDV